MADKPDTKKERRAALGSHKYDAEEYKKRWHVKYALGAAAKAGFVSWVRELRSTLEENPIDVFL